MKVKLYNCLTQVQYRVTVIPKDVTDNWTGYGKGRTTLGIGITFQTSLIQVLSWNNYYLD